jgi:tRNA-dihydrouridine synthase 1
MGAALLSNQDNACNIISNLSQNLSIPVTAKIRILDSVEATADFMKRLEAAGAAAITGNKTK